MIEEQATVSLVDGEFAEVETERASACGSCSAKGACGTSLLSKVFGSKHSHVRVLNPVGAQAGDRVIVGLDESALLKGSFLFYIVPLLFMFVLAMAGQWLAQHYFFLAAEPFSIAGGLLGLLAGLVWLRARSVHHNKNYQAVILRRLNKEQQHVSLLK